MGYVIKPLPYKKRSWKLQHQTYVGGRAIKDIPIESYASLGFSPSMTIEEARARKDAINSQEHLRHHETKRVAIISRLQKEDTALDAFLQPALVEAFESEVLYARQLKDKSKVESHWRAAKRVILAVKLDPKEWKARKERFYDYFSREAISLSYMKKILRLLNLWGEWRAAKHELFFAPIPFPSGLEKQRVADAYFDEGGGHESAPLTPAALDKKLGTLKPEHYNWLYLTVWLGLRPIEADSLHSSKNYRVEKVGKVDVLFVYQSKLTSVDRAKRWKPIPLVQPEQRLCLPIIRGGIFKRPIASVMRHHFDGVTLYGGRKGFTDLMLGRGQKLENISVWLGHMSIERTWRNYKDRQRVAFD